VRSLAGRPADGDEDGCKESEAQNKSDRWRMHIGAGPRSVNKNDDIYDHGDQKNSHDQPALDAYRRPPQPYLRA
jgi:hypothetical protein